MSISYREMSSRARQTLRRWIPGKRMRTMMLFCSMGNWKESFLRDISTHPLKWSSFSSCLGFYSSCTYLNVLQMLKISPGIQFWGEMAEVVMDVIWNVYKFGCYLWGHKGWLGCDTYGNLWWSTQTFHMWLYVGGFNRVDEKNQRVN